MLTLRRDQVRALGRELLERHVEPLAAEVAARHGLARDDARALVERGIAQALHHGIEGGPDVARYVDLLWALGDGFDTDPSRPWAAYILGHPELLPSVKLDLLEAKARAEGGERPGSPG